MVAIKKMALISFTINTICLFLMAALAFTGVGLVGVPFFVVGLGAANLFMMLYCMFKCEFPAGFSFT